MNQLKQTEHQLALFQNTLKDKYGYKGIVYLSSLSSEDEPNNFLKDSFFKEKEKFSILERSPQTFNNVWQQRYIGGIDPAVEDSFKLYDKQENKFLTLKEKPNESKL